MDNADEEKYKTDKHIDALSKQMSALYEKYGKAVNVGEGAVMSVLPPDIQKQHEALQKELKKYTAVNYPASGEAASDPETF